MQPDVIALLHTSRSQDYAATLAAGVTTVHVGSGTHRLLTGQSAVVRLAQFLIALWDQINRDKVIIRASGLAYSSLLATVPLIAVAMCLDSGADLPAGALDALVADRERALARLPADAAHATSATGRLARRVIEAELSILREFCGEPPA